MSDSEKPPGFKVTDRRSFSENGATESGPAAQDPPAEPAEPRPLAAGAQADDNRAFPPADFSTFILSLGSSVLIHLGEIEPPGETAKRRDLPMAKHTIDLCRCCGRKPSPTSPQRRTSCWTVFSTICLRYVEVVKAGS